MRQLKFVFTVSLLFFIGTYSCSQKNSPAASSIMGIFVASTPCSQGTRPLSGIPVTADCEFLKWHLTLFQDESKKIPTTFKLDAVYGMPEQGTPGFTGGGKKITMEGEWTITKGTRSNPHAIIYQLNDNKTKTTISFLKLSDDLLHLLDSDQRLMIGSAAWSYTLNKLANK